jgi:hypothetical protein
MLLVECSMLNESRAAAGIQHPTFNTQHSTFRFSAAVPEARTITG